jgi:predicted RNase H-like nuclease
MRVAGVDGCKAGWIAVTRGPDGDRVAIHARFADVLALGADMVAVDMPIGLPGRVTPETATRETSARAVIGQRQSSIFTVPSRAALAETEFRAACAANRAVHWAGKCVSKQTFFLFGKIREIDALVPEGGLPGLHETHPEVVFWAMNGGVPLIHPKKVAGRANEAGLAERRALLTSVAGYDPAFLVQRLGPLSMHAPDDLLDACACAWTAARIISGEALSFPPEPARDPRGIPMVILA